MSENTDDLEQTLMLAAAAADSRQYEHEINTEDASSEEEKEEKSNSDSYEAKNNSPISLDCKPKPETNQSSSRASQNNQSSSRTSVKRKREDDTPTLPSKKMVNSEGYSKVVATHYNLIEEKGLVERSRSRIVYMRSFHNWIKSMLINEYLTKIKDSKRQHNPPVRVHDMCCGKGGDLLKWKKGNITHLICSDIAEVSLDHCRQRYTDMKARAARERGGGNIYSIEYISGDSSIVRLREKYSDPSMKLDLVSCQFAFHYSFESLPQAECMMRNAAECLQPGGYFIGTIPDANEIVARAKRNDSSTFGNDVYQVTLDFDPNKPDFFGSKYNFHMDEVVDCPEFLVHFPTFVKLAKKYGLKLVTKEKFYDYYERMKYDGKQLLTNMNSLEVYPPYQGNTLHGTAEDDYDHAKAFIKGKGDIHIGTLSKSEWEASSIYITFAFEKVKNTWNADGTPCYDI